MMGVMQAVHYNIRVPAGRYVYYQKYIDISDKKGNIVRGEVVVAAGHDINFYVFDQKNFDAWKEGRYATPYVSAKRVQSYRYSFVPDHSDYYFFVLDNRYSQFAKVANITVFWEYEVIIKHRDAQKTAP